jgi:hypothetical protein
LTQTANPSNKELKRGGAKMISKMRNPVLALFVAVFMTIFITSPAPAALIPSVGSSHQSGTANLTDDLSTIQRALENKLVQERLRAYGFTPEEIRAKLETMTPTQIHLLAQASNDVLAGGDGIGVVIGVLVIIILVIIVLKLLNKEIIIKYSSLDCPACSDPAVRG